MIVAVEPQVRPASARRRLGLRRLGLRRRLVAAFAAGALALSTALALLTYELARTYLLDQRTRSLVRQTYVAASLVANELRSPEPDVLRALTSLVHPAGSNSVVLHEGRWFAVSVEVGREDIPAGLRSDAAAGTAARQVYSLRGTTHLAVGIPLPQENAAFFEVSSLAELDHTLGVLRNVLAGAAALTTLAGAGAGVWAGRRLLQPLSDAARAASAVGSGRLDVRLEPTGDADLDALADAFNGMTRALEARIERDARFASAVSHELRSPLTTLATSLEVLRARRGEMPERARAALDLLEADVRRFQRLVEDLLEISRIDAGTAELSLERVRPDELARHALRSAGAADLPVDVDPTAGGLVIDVDKRRFERVIVNLVDNARSHGGGIRRMAVEAADGSVRLAVEDAGPGVAPDDRQRIFEPFVRGRAAGRRGSADGTGLGLSLVAEHVRLHRGRVWVEDRPGGGARFVVELPAHPS
jgi:signal transduction histidine kinase